MPFPAPTLKLRKILTLTCEEMDALITAVNLVAFCPHLTSRIFPVQNRRRQIARLQRALLCCQNAQTLPIS